MFHMEYDVVVVGGFGASNTYMDAFCKRLQYISQLRVLNHSLRHGISDELERGLFRHPFHSLQTTITECLVKTDYHTLLRNCQSGKIHLLVGANDFYRHFSRHLQDAFPNIVMHTTIGDHHFLYHHPKYSAEKVNGIIIK